MNNKFLKLLSTVACVLALSAGVLFADEEKKKECPCEKEKPKAVGVADDEKKKECPCEKEKPKAVAADEEKKDCKKCCPSEKPKA
ncbi:MAG: hypothetical protein ACO268_02915 [Opitutales bacterium]